MFVISPAMIRQDRLVSNFMLHLLGCRWLGVFNLRDIYFRCLIFFPLVDGVGQANRRRILTSAALRTVSCFKRINFRSVDIPFKEVP